MELRKVQMTGGSSYVITLPKEWVKSLKIKKNEPLGLVVQSDGTLLITPKTTEEQVHRTKVIDVDEIEDATYLYRLLIGAYMMGYSEIVMKAREGIQPFVRDCVINFTQTVIGHEIIEEDLKSITTRDLLNPMEMSFPTTIKRMAILVRTMHRDAITALVENRKSLAQDVIKRDRDVDRLYWLIARQYNLVLRDVTLSKKMGISQEEATFYFLIGRLMERTADHAVRIAINAPILLSKRTSKKIINAITSASDASLKIFIKSIDAWVDRDLDAAESNIESVSKLISSCEKINRGALNLDSRSSISVGYISESIRRTGEYAANISELVINYLV